MMYLSNREIRQLIEQQDLVKYYTDLDIQLQQCGFDMTLGEVWTTPHKKRNTSKYKALRRDGAYIDFTNEERRLASMRQLKPRQDGWYRLYPGAYVFITVEEVNLPSWLAYFMLPRSSLTRNGHVFSTALGDPGYSGRNRLSAHIGPPGINIKTGARFCQMVFVKLSQPVSELYNGVYQENQP